jgi:hypothetical protein
MIVGVRLNTLLYLGLTPVFWQLCQGLQDPRPLQVEEYNAESIHAESSGKPDKRYLLQCRPKPLVVLQLATVLAYSFFHLSEDATCALCREDGHGGTIQPPQSCLLSLSLED